MLLRGLAPDGTVMKRAVAAVVLVAVAAGGVGWWWLHRAPTPTHGRAMSMPSMSACRPR